jgi:hypothetical protein
MDKKLLWGGVVLLLGLGCLAAALVAWSVISGFVDGASTTQGRVVELVLAGSGRSPVVRFTAPDGREITFSGLNASNPPAYQVGEAVTVLFHPAAPQLGPRIQSASEVWTPVLVFALMGLLFVGVGLVLVVGQVKERRKRAWLRRHGQRVEARVTRVESVPVKSGLPQYCVHAEWVNPESGITQFFTSDAILEDPTEQLGPEIAVLVDPEDDERYWVDLSALEPPA